MGKLWISLLLLFVAVAYATLPVYDSNEANEAQDYYDNWYDDILNLDDNINDAPKDRSEEVLDGENENGEPIESLFEKIQKYDDDYQIEDNRSDLIEENIAKQVDNNFRVGEDEKNNDNQELIKSIESSFEEELEAVKDKEINNKENEENIPQLKVVNTKENNDQSDNNSNDAQSEEISFDINSDIESLPLPPKGEIDEEIKRTMSEAKNEVSDEGNLDDSKNSQNINELEEEAKDKIDFGDILDEDSVDMAYKDLNEDLNKLMETWKKLSLDKIEMEKDADDSVRPDDILEYEEKYGRPYKEGVVLSQRDDIYEGDEKNNDQKLDENTDQQLDSKIPVEAPAVDAEASDVVLGKEEYDVNDMISAEEDIIVDAKEEIDDDIEDNEDYEDDEDDDNDDQIGAELDNEGEDKILGDDLADAIAKISVNNQNTNENYKNINNLNENSDDAKTNDVQQDEKVENIFENQPRKPFVFDAFISDGDEPEQKDEATTQTDKKFKTMNVTDLSPEQYSLLMETFMMLHKDELDVNSDAFEGDIAVIHVPISLDAPVVVSSPNYPEPYPTNNIIDWMLEGDGVGIELNITDLLVNGVGGDYLLIKPGGVDESGSDGLVFSYHLDEPRRYRFLDVDRMFVRFVAQPGWSFPFLRGFQLSVKMVAPLPRMEEEPLPEPEPELPEPVETLTLVLGGIPAMQFSRIQEEFRVLIADMATMFINANGIDLGLNTTLEVTQITNVAICNINWPNFENCTQVTFAVPLVYEEDEEEDEPRLNSRDLITMWSQYNSKDPFAARLRRLGITEFASPNDSGVLAVWLVLSAGVLVIMVIMAFALWRYSCFDTYTRMPEFSSRDSLYNEKQGLDLYPTPHQTLPPLYESEYNWADGKFDDSARVDMSGYTNRNFTRDELSDIESDEDVISTRDRKIVISPKDGYEA